MEPFRIILHVGTGKTGTSAIQQSLRESPNELLVAGCAYWGLMLEHAPVQSHFWQRVNARSEFSDRDQSVVTEEVVGVVLESIAALSGSGIVAAIWSNEWFFSRSELFAEIIAELDAKGVDVHVVAYVRNHVDWIQSAYRQWGIKHKTYQGGLLPFDEYVRLRPPGFAASLRDWRKVTLSNFLVRNYDACSDVVSDFLGATGIAAHVVGGRSNESATTEELFLRAIFNGALKEPVLPEVFDRQMRIGGVDLSLDPSEWLSSLLPDDEALERVAEASQDDREAVNSLLEDCGQPPLSASVRPRSASMVDLSRMVGILSQLVVTQQRRLNRLERLVERKNP